MNILYISSGISFGKHKYKCGINHSLNFLKALSIDNEITLVMFTDFDKEELRPLVGELCEEVILVRRNAYNRFAHRILRLYCFLRNELAEFYKDRSMEMKAQLEALNQPDRFDIAIYDNYSIVQYSDCINHIPKLLNLTDSMTLKSQEALKNPTIGLFNRAELVRRMGRTKELEKNDYRAFSKCIVVAKNDRDTLLELNPLLDIVVIPLHIDTEYFKKGSDEKEGLIIFTGIPWAEHNADAIHYFCADIYPLIKMKTDRVRLLLIGGRQRKEIKRLIANDPNVITLGFFDDIRPYLDHATVFISPMRIGSGMNMKMLEAMSMSKAIVATEYANRSIGLVSGREAVICRDRFEFADAVVSLLTDTDKRHFLGANARKKAEADFSIEVYARKLQELIEATTGDKGKIP